MRVLLIEDDLELANGLAGSLAQSNYAVDSVHSGKAALAACKIIDYELLILDLGLPDSDGIDVLSSLRKQGVVAPILILTARDGLQDRIVGLDAGGDDYLAKPFALGELEARIRALLRRKISSGARLSFESLEFDPASRVATIHGTEIRLTARELAVLELLLRRQGRVVSKQQIIESLYTWEGDVNPSSIEVFVSRLRRKFEEAHADVGVRVLRGLGYRLEKLRHE